MKQIAFFFRNTADIDHIIPLAVALARTGRWLIRLIIGSHPGYARDPRFKYAAKMQNVSVLFFFELSELSSREKFVFFELFARNFTPDECNDIEIWMPCFCRVKRVGFTLMFYNLLIRFLYFAFSLRCLSGTGLYRKIVLFAKVYFSPVVLDSFKKKIVKRCLTLFCGELVFTEPNVLFFEKTLDKIFTSKTDRVLVFDWTNGPFCRWLSAVAGVNNCKVVSVPHGLPAFSGSLVGENELEINKKEFLDFTFFDYFIKPSHFMSEVNELFKEGTQKVLGSPRNTSSWIEELRRITPKFECGPTECRLKVALFLRDIGYATHWQEVGRLVPLIQQFSGVHLVVRHHTRAMGQRMLRQQYPELFVESHNVSVVCDDTMSSAIVEWADVILDCGTGMAAHSLVTQKNFISVEYVNAFTTLVAELVPSCAVHSRDELCKRISLLLSDRSYSIVDRKERERYICEALHGGQTDVINAYLSFFDDIAL